MKTHPSTHLDMGILAFAWQHLWHHSTKARVIFTIGTLATFVVCLTNIIVPYAIARFIDAVSHPDQTQNLWHYGWLIVLVTLGIQVGTYRLRVWLYWRLTVPQLLARMRQTLYDRMMMHGTDFFANNFSGALANKIRLIADGTQDLFENVVVKLFESILFTCFAAILLARINFSYAVAIMAVLIALSIIAVKLSKKCNVFSEVKANAVTQMTGFLVDAITNHTAIRHFVGWEKEREIFTAHQDRVVATTRALSYSYNTIWLTFGAATAILQSFLLWVVARDFQQGVISIGDITLIATLGIRVTQQFSEVVYTLPNISISVGTIREALHLIYQPLQQQDPNDTPPLTIAKGEIVFSDVDFSYPNGTRVFKNLSLTIPAGQKIGLVGFSGSGKSTLMHLLLRHYDIQSGTITIDGQSIQNVTMDSLRRAIAAVPQDPVLFHRSLYDNIAYGDHDAGHSDVLNAAMRAEADDFISELRDGYDTKVGERGVKLSGGQRQRIAIARAILSEAPILVLDEATSALDSVTEKAIQTALIEAMKNRTTIVIAHRLATLTSLDRLLVLDQGRIVEDGSLDELLAQNGHFARLWQMQSGGFLPDSDLSH